MNDPTCTILNCYSYDRWSNLEIQKYQDNLVKWFISKLFIVPLYLLYNYNWYDEY